METKIEFLHSAISDAQELIRFIDTKTAFAVTILGAYIVTFFLSIEKIIQYSFGYSQWFWISVSIFIAFLILCIIITVRIIKPTNNPTDNINFGAANRPDVKYFLSPNNYSKGFLQSFRNSKRFKLKENYEIYVQKLSAATDDELLEILTLELFKVSFIRNIKNDRFNILLWFMLITSFLFFFSYFIFSFETKKTIDYLQFMKDNCNWSIK